MVDSIKKQIQNLYESLAYQKLVDYYKQDNIFSIIHAARLENIHSAFFAWLLDAQKQHGMGDNALRFLLRLYATKYKGNEFEWGNAFLLGDYVISNLSITTEKSVEKSAKTNKKTKPSRMDIYVEADLVPNQVGDNSTLKTRKLMLCIENKIYSSEHDEQTITYHNYLEQRANDSLNYEDLQNYEDVPLLVELYLSPTSEKRPQAESFISITYQDFLRSVLEPLLNISDIVDSARCYIKDYIRALGRPTLIQKDSNSAKNKCSKLYSVLAISKQEKKTLGEIYKMPIFKMAYIANQGLDKKVQQKEEWNKISLEEVENNKVLLDQLWISNRDLFEAVAIICGDLPIEVENNRDTTKYTIKYDGNILNLKNKNGSLRRASKSEASFLIFKAWCAWWKEQHHGENPSYETIDKAFPIELNGYYNNRKFFNTLFISCTDKGFEDPNGYNKNQKWDFYTDDEHKLHLKEGEFYSLKMWRKSDFDNLREYIDSKLIEFKNKLEIIEHQ